MSVCLSPTDDPLYPLTCLCSNLMWHLQVYLLHTCPYTYSHTRHPKDSFGTNKIGQFMYLQNLRELLRTSHSLYPPTNTIFPFAHACCSCTPILPHSILVLNYELHFMYTSSSTPKLHPQQHHHEYTFKEGGSSRAAVHLHDV